MEYKPRALKRFTAPTRRTLIRVRHCTASEERNTSIRSNAKHCSKRKITQTSPGRTAGPHASRQTYFALKGEIGAKRKPKRNLKIS